MEKQYDIPYADIPKGIDLSLKNSDRHRTDSKILAEEKRYNSAIPLVTLAVEEFGKALWLSEYFEKNMSISHKGMGISEDDWEAASGHMNATLDKFQVPERERNEVIGFIESTKADIVE